MLPCFFDCRFISPSTVSLGVERYNLMSHMFCMKMNFLQHSPTKFSQLTVLQTMTDFIHSFQFTIKHYFLTFYLFLSLV